jgi:hypothetical protein
MNRGWTWVGSLAVAGAVVAFAIQRMTAKDDTTGKDVAELQRLVAELRSTQAAAPAPGGDLRLLDRKVAELERRQRELPQAALVQPPSPTEPAERPLDPADVAQEQLFRNEQLVEELRTKLDARVAMEPVDVSWRNQTLAELKKTFTPITGSTVRNAECRSQLCRIEVEHQTANSQRGLAREISGQAPFDQEVVYRYDLNSKPPKTTLYVARAGTSLSNLAASDGI